jgi:branched-chain amino acid transport system substrate-binding protein
VIGSGAGASVMTGPKCSKDFVHWTYDTYELGHALGHAVTAGGGKTWYFISADYAFGKDLRDNCADAVIAAGGKVIGDARHPLNTADFSSFVLQAQASGADVVALANAGGDLNNCLKQAKEFGLAAKQKLATFVLNITNVPSLGLDNIASTLIATPFYWDFNDGTRAFSKRFQEKDPKKFMPNDMQAGMYAATLHLMKAYAQVKSAEDGIKLVDAMKAMPTDDPLFGKGTIRADGRHMHDVYLMKVKSPAQSKGPWDAFEMVSTIAPKDAFRPLDKGGCPFIKA